MLQETNRNFHRATILVFVAVVLVNYLPVWSGKLPFPEDLVARHAAWNPHPEAAPKPAPEISDLITSFYPYRLLVAQAVNHGELPLWNPYILGGTPLAATAQPAPFYPLNIPYYILPLKLAWTVCILLRGFLAALFMSLFVRALGGSTAGAIFSGIVFSFSGFMTAWQGQSMGDAAIWLPLICYCILRLRESPSTRRIAAAALAFAMPVLAGHPETAMHLTLCGIAFAIALGLDKRFAVAFVAAGVLALGLAAVQIGPTWEWLNQLGQFVHRIPPALSIHDGQAVFSRDISASPSSALIRIPEGAAYFGLLTLMSAPLAWFQRSRRLFYFFSILAIVAAAIAYGIGPARWTATHIPVFQSFKNGRLILMVTFAFTVLAGLAVSLLEREKVYKNIRLIAVCMMLVTAAGIFEVHRATWVPVSFMRGPWGALVFALAAGALLAVNFCGVLRGRAFSFTACGIAAIEMISFSYGYTGFTTSAKVFPTAPIYEFLQQRGDPATFRIAKAGYPIPANSGIVYGLESAEGYEIPNERAKMFSADLIEQRDDAIFYLAEKVVRAEDRRLDMLNVKYWTVIAGSPEFREFAAHPQRFAQVFSEGSIVVFENRNSLPRLFAVPQSGIESIVDPLAQMARIRDPHFDPERSVVFSQRPAEAAGVQTAENRFNSSIQHVSSSMNSSTFRAQTSHAAVLVLSQVYYPGWKAAIDGKEVSVYPVDSALTGIPTPAGNHIVRIFYQPRSFRFGAILSLLSLSTAIGLSRKTWIAEVAPNSLSS